MDILTVDYIIIPDHIYMNIYIYIYKSYSYDLACCAIM